MTAPAAQAVACIVSPNAADAELATSVLRADGIEARSFASLEELAAALDDRAACLVLVEDALTAEGMPPLAEALGRLPAWCDPPLIVVSRDVAALRAVVPRAFPDSGNVQLLERPLNLHTLVSAVEVALRASARQREVGELIAEREAAVQLRDEFLAMLAHELRNPLAPMRYAVDIMRMLKVDDPRVVKNYQILDRQVTHLARMVDDLMDVARLERGKVTLQKSRVDLNTVVASAVESCLEPAQQRGHRVSLRFATDALPVDIDAVRVEQIVCNLVNNAAKFTPRPGEIRVETAVEDGFALVVVEDEGVGFSREMAERLFDPFLQLDPTIERASGGLGMGLTIVKRLAELHGGSVQATSDGPGKGSRFVVRLPLAAALSQARGDGERNVRARRPRRIVVIEDNPDIRETMRMLLDLWGHEVSFASDGPSGLERVLVEQPELALIDVGLPGMSGYDVARAIRRRMPEADLRLVAVTGYGQPSDQERAAEAGFDGHLLKPVTADALDRLLAD